MSDEGIEAQAPRADAGTTAGTRHPVRRARRSDGASFVVECERDGDALWADRDGAGWSVRGFGNGARLERLSRGGFVLDVPDREGAGGRTACPVGLGPEVNVRHVLLDDGRLYRLVVRSTGDRPVELHGWEVDGAYLTGERDGEAWVIRSTVSGEGLDDLRALTLLVVAELLDQEGTWRDERHERQA